MSVLTFRYRMKDATSGKHLLRISWAVNSDEDTPRSRENLTRIHGEALAQAQRAHRQGRIKAIHTKITHCRRDWAHTQTTAIVKRAKLIVVGNVSTISSR